MSTTQSHAEHQEDDELDESPEERLRRLAESDLPGDAILLGVDGEGYDHYLSPYRQTVYILDDDQLDREVDVHGRSLTSYGQWVSRTRGRWAEWHCLENGMADLIDELAAEVTPAHAGD